MNRKNLFLKLSGLMVITCVLFFAGCKKDNNNNLSINYMYNYYPVDSGHWIIYNVDSVNFSYDGVKHYYDTSHYQMQAFYGDTIHDLLDSVNFRVYYSTRPDNNSNWGTPYGTYGLRTMTTLQAVENDIRFIKLVFPPQLNGTWNGNLYVPYTGPSGPYAVFGNWNYYYENIDTTISINGQTYNNCVVVSEVNNVNVVNKTVRTEIYAPTVGMIYQEWEALSVQGGSTLIGWDTGATQGFSIHMWALSHNP